MSFSKKQILDRALRIATMTGTDAHQSAVVDNAVVLEDYFYSALKQSVLAGASDPSESAGLKRDHTISITNGIGTLPDVVLEECLNDSTVYNDDDDQTSYQPRYADYLRPVHSLIGYYAVQGTSFLYRAPGGDAGEFDGDINLVAVSLPDIPATITDAITISSATAERTIQILAGMIRGA
jgi:hypothetical protein